MRNSIWDALFHVMSVPLIKKQEEPKHKAMRHLHYLKDIALDTFEKVKLN